MRVTTIFTRAICLAVLACICAACTEDGEKQPAYGEMDSVYLLFKDIYYWNEDLPAIETFNPARFSSLPAMVENIRELSPLNPKLNIPVDRWSFAMKNEDWLATLNGESKDFGLGLRFSAEDDLRISWVQPNSSSGVQQLKRGMRVTRINDIVPNYALANSLRELIVNEKELELEVEDIASRIKISKSSYAFSPVIKHDVFTDNGKKIGYIHLMSFTADAKEECKTIFEKFKNEQISDLIIDLRYNGGGLLSVMEDIASYIVPDNKLNSIFYKLHYNDDYEAFDENVFFKINSNRLTIDKVKFIVGPNTASASEIMIHALSPHMVVETIGMPTHGKLLGMQPTTMGDYTIVPVSFIVFNAVEKQRDPYYVIDPMYFSGDDLKNDFSKDEQGIATALRGAAGGRQGNTINFAKGDPGNLTALPSFQFSIR
jgi:carboxyl-terminal processing protease